LIAGAGVGLSLASRTARDQAVDLLVVEPQDAAKPADGLELAPFHEAVDVSPAAGQTSGNLVNCQCVRHQASSRLRLARTLGARQ